MMSLKRKRTVAKEKRLFNSKWEMDYFMIETAVRTILCLICCQVVKTVKGDNARQHFRRHMSHPYAKLEGESKKICVENLKKSERQQASCMSSLMKSTNSRCEASYRVAYHLGVAGSLFPMENWLSDAS